jgi:type VI secretion system Hcp family effector
VIVGLVRRIGKPWKAALLVAVGAAGGGAVLAAASVSGSGGVITACVNVGVSGATTVPAPNLSGGNVNIIDPAAGQACQTTPIGANAVGQNQQTTLTWNANGPTGPTGLGGPTGSQGTAGLKGAIGPTNTVVAGNTLTLPNREVITVGNSDVSAPQVTSTRSVGILKVLGPHGSIGKSSIEIFSFSFGASNPANTGGSGGASGKRTHSPITIVKEVDSASPQLLQGLVTNEVFKQVALSFDRPAAGGKEVVYQTITLTNATIASMQRYTAGHVKLESLSFNYQKLLITNPK